MGAPTSAQSQPLHIFYPGEHNLNSVALFIDALIMVNFCFCVRFRWDTAFTSMSGQKGTYLCGSIGFVRDESRHSAARYQTKRDLNIVGFTSGDQKVNRKTKFVAQKMKFRGQSSSTFSYMPIRLAAGHAGSGAVNFKVCGIDHGKAFFIHSFSKNTEDFFKDSRLAPALEPGINSCPFTIKFRQMPPRGSIFDYPDNATEDKAVTDPLARFLLWQMTANPVKQLLVDKGCFHF